LLEQAVELSKECRKFLTQKDASDLFQDCPFQQLCNKDENGKPGLTPELYLKNACYLVLLYQGADQARTAIRKPEPLWPEMVKCRLMVAAVAGEENLVRWLVQNNGHERNGLNHKSNILGSVLLAAVLGKRYNIVIGLIRYGADPRNICAWEQEPPLTWAVFRQDVRLVRALLTSPLIDPNQTTSDCDEPLFVACFYGLEDIAKVLLRDPRVRPDTESNFSGLTPLGVAIKKNRAGIVRVLLDRKQHINVNRHTPLNECALYAAAGKGRSEIVSYLLKWPDINVNFMPDEPLDHSSPERVTPLRLAVLNRHQKTATLLLQFSQANPNLISTEHEDPLLILAAKKGMIDVVDILLHREGFDVNTTVNRHGHNAVSSAASAGQDGLFHYLLNTYPVDMTVGKLSEPESIRHVPDGNIMKTLLRIFPERINYRDEMSGETALMWASGFGRLGVVRVLLEAGADASLRNRNGQTALEFARGQQKVVEIFNEYGHY
jgi:ankyrin repeat protein